MTPEQLASLEHCLQLQAASVRPPLQQLCGYALGGGQRTRAALLLAAAEGVLGGEDAAGANATAAAPTGSSIQRTVADRPGATAAMHAAVAVEMMHAATLLQDDIFDGAATRRGRCSAHAAFGKAQAILASDWLLLRALEIAADVGSVYARALSGAARAMVEAEMSELDRSVPGSWQAAVSTGLQIARGKTGALFGAALCGAAAALGKSDALCGRWQRLGEEVGVTYQLLDDCADCFGDAAELGKPTGNDLLSGRLTLPVLLAGMSVARRDPSFSLRSLRAGQCSPGCYAQLTAALCAAQTRRALANFVERRIAEHRREARCLRLDSHPMQQWLGMLCDRRAMYLGGDTPVGSGQTADIVAASYA